MKLLGVIITSVLILGLIEFVVDKKGEINMSEKTFKRLIGFGVTLVLVVVVGLSTLAYVPVNSVGTKINRMNGEISDEPLGSGIHLRNPITTKVSTVSTELRNADIDDMAVTTKDAQALTIDIEMQYKIDPTKAPETYRQFKSVKEEDWIDVFVYQRIHRGVQEVASKYTIIEIMGEKRGQFQVEVDKEVASALEANYMLVHSTSVDDLQSSESIVKAIEDNAKAKQKVETARQKQEEEAIKNQMVVEKAEAEAKANKLLSQSVDENLIKYLEAEARMEHGWYKYNGMSPQIMEKGE